MNSITSANLVSRLKEISDSEIRIKESLTHIQASTRDRRVREVLEMQVESTTRHLDQISQGFENLHAAPSRKTVEQGEKHLLRALALLRERRGEPDFEDTVIQALGRVAQLQVQRYAQATVPALEAGEHVLAALLQDILDEYSALVKRLTKEVNKRNPKKSALAA